MINDQEVQQKMLQTKTVKLEKDNEKASKRLQEALTVKPQKEQQSGGPKRPDKEMVDISKILAGTLLSQATNPTDKKQEKTTSSFCACGATDPKYRGYCRDCLTRLKTTFDRYLEGFRQVSDEYDQFTGSDMKAADDKIRLMKNKIEQYQVRLSDSEIIDVIERHGKLAQSDENRAFAEFKAQVEGMKQETTIAVTRHDIELEDLRKQADYLES